MGNRVRPVWLFSMDSEQFWAPPTTTGALVAYYGRYGRALEALDAQLVHFRSESHLRTWLAEEWPQFGRVRAHETVAQGLAPVFAFSCYTWNTDAFLELMQQLQRDVPQAVFLGGGPQVQKPEDYLGRTPLQVIALGEAEVTFQEWLDCGDLLSPHGVPGLAFVQDGQVLRTGERPRQDVLDRFPSALEVVPLRGSDGQPLYQQVAYETSRGCPFRCAYCEWGTGAIGTKMHQFSLGRIREDLERLVAGGIQDIWLSDSNFGALREDLDKTRLIVELRERTGLPQTFATSWSKAHNSRVQEIVLLLQRHGLLQNYNLALQTLTPLALKLSHRTNMRSNRYEPIAKEMAREGVPIATELIWGLPGDTLAEFEANLDRLLTYFPNINIFGYTLLPGTEFYEKRQEYQLQTVPVAGYGSAKGAYVIGSHTFDQDEGLEGYYLIAAHILLIRGHIMPLTVRLVALDGRMPVSAMLRYLLRQLLGDLQALVPELDLKDRMVVYEQRARLYLAMLARHEETFALLQHAISEWLNEREAPAELTEQVLCTLRMDAAFCPRTGDKRQESYGFDFDVHSVEQALGRMELPPLAAFGRGLSGQFLVDHPAHAGEVLKDPDGGSWMRGRFVVPPVEHSA